MKFRYLLIALLTSAVLLAFTAPADARGRAVFRGHPGWGWHGHHGWGWRGGVAVGFYGYPYFYPPVGYACYPYPVRYYAPAPERIYEGRVVQNQSRERSRDAKDFTPNE